MRLRLDHALWAGSLRGWRATGAVGFAMGLLASSCTMTSKLPPAPGALDTGARVPAVTLADQTGTPVDLAAASAHGPLVIVFYRGFWCPICMSELRGLQSRMDGFRAAGVRVIAICPDPVEQNRAVVERFGLAFPILSDPELAATNAFGVRHVAGGTDGADIPRPATYVTDAGVIRWRDLTDDFRVRPKPDDVLAAARAVHP